MASVCIAYFQDVLLRDEFILEDIEDSENFKGILFYPWGTKKKGTKRLQYPFIEYAVRQWDKHFNHSNQQGVSIIDKYPKFFFNFSTWKPWSNLELFSIHGKLFSAAALLGLTVLMQRILEEKRHWLYWKYLFSKKDREADLRTASWYGHLSTVKLLIKIGVHLDCESIGGETPLGNAVRLGHREVAQFLLTRGANINGPRPQDSPLMYAVLNDQSELVKLLLEWKAHSETKSDRKWSSLRETSKSRCALDVNCRDRCGNTFLHMAMQKGNIEVIQLLMTHPDVDSKLANIWGLSPMHLALTCLHVPSICMASRHNVDA